MELRQQEFVKKQKVDRFRAAVFVTGTDTGVGKTVVTAALAAAFARHGYPAGVMKPIETGVSSSIDARSDAARLRSASRNCDALREIRPYVFRRPLAPLDAARSERRSIHLSAIVRAYGRLRLHHNLLLVEGVGGLHVPITPAADVLDLIVNMKSPVLVIGRAGLGGVNHAMLTLHALRQRKVRVIALVLNRTKPVRTAVARRQERSTRSLLRECAGVPVIGPLPFLAGLEARFDQSVSRLATHAEIKKLMKRVLASGRGSHRLRV